jgi:hypothetical protein
LRLHFQQLAAAREYALIAPAGPDFAVDLAMPGGY